MGDNHCINGDLSGAPKRNWFSFRKLSSGVRENIPTFRYVIIGKNLLFDQRATKVSVATTIFRFARIVMPFCLC
jgi:hypothetical protein